MKSFVRMMICLMVAAATISQAEEGTWTTKDKKARIEEYKGTLKTLETEWETAKAAAAAKAQSDHDAAAKGLADVQGTLDKLNAAKIDGRGLLVIEGMLDTKSGTAMVLDEATFKAQKVFYKAQKNGYLAQMNEAHARMGKSTPEMDAIWTKISAIKDSMRNLNREVGYDEEAGLTRKDRSDLRPTDASSGVGHNVSSKPACDPSCRPARTPRAPRGGGKHH